MRISVVTEQCKPSIALAAAKDSPKIPPKYGVYRLVDGKWEHTEFADAR